MSIQHALQKSDTTPPDSFVKPLTPPSAQKSGTSEQQIIDEIEGHKTGRGFSTSHLLNQTSDILRSQLDSRRWKLTPVIVERVYKAVPAGCILRRLCAAGLGSSFKAAGNRSFHFLVRLHHSFRLVYIISLP